MACVFRVPRGGDTGNHFGLPVCRKRECLSQSRQPESWTLSVETHAAEALARF